MEILYSTTERNETIRAARAAGLRVAPQGSGHGATALGDLSDTILLRTDPDLFWASGAAAASRS